LFWIALVPAVLSIVLLTSVKEQPGPKHQRENIFETWGVLSPQFKRFLISAGIFSLSYFSFGFLLLRAQSVGFSVKEIVLLYALFNISCVAASPFIGKLGDRVGRAKVIILGYVIYFLMCLGFAFASNKWEVISLFVIYGLFYSIDEAQSKAFIADIEVERRASAIGMYNFVTGALYLPASLIAGILWMTHPVTVFVLAACIALIAILSFLILRPEKKLD
jgi:MFS family permease